MDDENLVRILSRGVVRDGLCGDIRVRRRVPWRRRHGTSVAGNGVHRRFGRHRNGETGDAACLNCLMPRRPHELVLSIPRQEPIFTGGKLPLKPSLLLEAARRRRDVGRGVVLSTADASKNPPPRSRGDESFLMRRKCFSSQQPADSSQSEWSDSRAEGETAARPRDLFAPYELSGGTESSAPDLFSNARASSPRGFDLNALSLCCGAMRRV